jgi:acetylornithine deacetylase/succinyl-diaminopimelate desuccinylase-like protein
VTQRRWPCLAPGRRYAVSVTSLELLQRLVQTETVNPPGNEGDAVEIVEAYLSSAGLEVRTLVSPGGRPTLVGRVEGPSDQSALVLLSHSDVVPVEEDSWTHDPFGGELVDGFIWGRGALDMKSISVMHAQATVELSRSGATPNREVIVVMAADEEAAGDEGAAWFVDQHPDTVGLGEGRPPPEVLCEGAYGLIGAFPRPVIPIALGEKTAVWFELVSDGNPGHGALPPQRQALVSIAGAVKAVAGFGRPRVHPVMREQFATLARAASGPNAAILKGLASPAGSSVARAVAPQLRKAGVLGLLLSDSITPTQMSAGYKPNVVPGEARASFDCRLLPDTDVDDFIANMDKRAKRYGARVENVTQKGRGPASAKSPLYDILERASGVLMPDALVTPSLSPAITDARFFRARGATAYGWCPLVLTPELLATIHGDDERIAVGDFEKAVSVTSDVVRQAATS